MHFTSVKDLIAQNKIMIFSKSYCPYCTNAKNLLQQKKAAFCSLELDKESSEVCDTATSQLRELTGQKTFPNIFINSKHIGGFSDLKKLNDEKKLDKMLFDGPAAG
jgi:glutaredoxin 3